jgi:hypothetical protein
MQWKKGLDSGKMTLKEGAVVKVEVRHCLPCWITAALLNMPELQASLGQTVPACHKRMPPGESHQEACKGLREVG